MCASGTASSHTVCQMPVVGVYQMPCGFCICLPIGWVPLSVGSHAATTNCCGPVGVNAAVMSKLNGSYPPRCVPTVVPFTVTVVSQSTAPKCSSTRLPFHAAGTANERLYHSRFFSPTVRFTPESADSTGYGTRILPSNLRGAPCAAGRMA